MSALTKTKTPRTLRIIALPLTRTPQLIYYHFDFTSSTRERELTPTWTQRTQSKLAAVWAGFGKAPEGTWKLKTFRYGERLVDRIDFEELALKGLDPSVGPSLSDVAASASSSAEKGDTNSASVQIPLIYPSSFTTTPSLQLHDMISRRAPRHRKGFLTWLTIAPITAPFAIVPIIPNLPFFFCCWRSWHHYKAWKASQYLESLMECGCIVPQPSPELDAIYAGKAVAPSDSDTESTTSKATEKPEPTSDRDSDASTDPNVLLHRPSVPSILSLFGLPPSHEADVYRAMLQARLRSESERKQSENS